MHDYIEWFTVETDEQWTKISTKDRKTGWFHDRWVRFTRGRCLVCSYTKTGQFRTRVENAMEKHADEHIAKLEGKTTASMRVSEQVSLLKDVEEPPF